METGRPCNAQRPASAWKMTWTLGTQTPGSGSQQHMETGQPFDSQLPCDSPPHLKDYPHGATQGLNSQLKECRELGKMIQPLLLESETRPLAPEVPVLGVGPSSIFPGTQDLDTLSKGCR